MRSLRTLDVKTAHLDLVRALAGDWNELQWAAAAANESEFDFHFQSWPSTASQLRNIFNLLITLKLSCKNNSAAAGERERDREFWIHRNRKGGIFTVSLWAFLCVFANRIIAHMNGFWLVQAPNCRGVMMNLFSRLLSCSWKSRLETCHVDGKFSALFHCFACFGREWGDSPGINFGRLTTRQLNSTESAEKRGKKN